MTKTVEQHHSEGPTIDLKDRQLAAFLAWLIPGLGHLYQGRRGKAALFFVCIMGTFLYGLYLGSSNQVLDPADPDKPTIGWGRVVYFSWAENNKRLHYLCQIGVGLPALPALVQWYRMENHKKVWWNGFMAPPRLPNSPLEGPNVKQPTLHELHYTLNRFFDLGTLYTTVAGLLNVLAIYDAFAGPVMLLPVRKKDEEEEAGEKKGDEKKPEKKPEEKKTDEKKGT